MPVAALRARRAQGVIRKDEVQEVERRLETFRQKVLQDLSAQSAAPH
jgi:hypothetical protein